MNYGNIMGFIMLGIIALMIPVCLYVAYDKKSLIFQLGFAATIVFIIFIIVMGVDSAINPHSLLM